MALSPADRIALGLDDPSPAPLAGEFIQARPVVPAYTPNLKLVLKADEKATTPKIRTMVNELLAGNVEAANQALQTLFAANPKVGLELYLELAQFSLPKLKAVAVAIDDRTDNPRSMGFSELQKLLQGEG